jgi:drug/metabolite transporter (DMT)-like permease
LSAEPAVALLLGHVLLKARVGMRAGIGVVISLVGVFISVSPSMLFDADGDDGHEGDGAEAVASVGSARLVGMFMVAAAAGR